MRHHRQNLHNHTRFSDGRHSPSAVIAAATAAGLGFVAITDHFYTRKVFRSGDPADWHRERFLPYLAAADEYRRTAPPVADPPALPPTDGEIHPLPKATARPAAAPPAVWWGVELDLGGDRLGMPIAALPWRELARLDLLLLEYLGESERGGMPLTTLATLREHWGGPLVLAHPDLAHLLREPGPEILAAELNRYRVWVEVVAGTRNRGWFEHPAHRRFLEAVDGLTIGSDTHLELDEVGLIDQAVALLTRYGLLDRLARPVTPRGDLRTRPTGSRPLPAATSTHPGTDPTTEATLETVCLLAGVGAGKL